MMTNNTLFLAVQLSVLTLAVSPDTLHSATTDVSRDRVLAWGKVAALSIPLIAYGCRWLWKPAPKPSKRKGETIRLHQNITYESCLDQDNKKLSNWPINHSSLYEEIKELCQRTDFTDRRTFLQAAARIIEPYLQRCEQSAIPTSSLVELIGSHGLLVKLFERVRIWRWGTPDGITLQHCNCCNAGRYHINTSPSKKFESGFNIIPLNRNLHATIYFSTKDFDLDSFDAKMRNLLRLFHEMVHIARLHSLYYPLSEPTTGDTRRDLELEADSAPLLIVNNSEFFKHHLALLDWEKEHSKSSQVKPHGYPSLHKRIQHAQELNLHSQ